MTSKDELHIKLEGLGDNELTEICSTSGCRWNTEIRNRYISRIKAILKENMVLTVGGSEKLEDWEIKLFNYVSSLKSEGQMIEFKLGLTNLRDQSFNKGLMLKIVQTLAAMANTNPRRTGSLIIGVADNADAAEEWHNHYNYSYIKCGDSFVTGVMHEANKYYGGLDNYRQRIKEAIQAINFSEKAKGEILQNMKVAKYRDKVVLVLELSSDEPVYVENKLFVRHDSSTNEVKPEESEFNSVMQKFFQGTHLRGGMNLFY